MFKLITNNAELCNSVKKADYINGSSLDVLISVRGLVHSGSIILTHPLCGNLRPSHQPFRSVIIDELSGSADIDSLTLIENAVNIYRSSELIMPYELDDYSLADYAYIDSELMRESLERYRLIKNNIKNENLCTAPSLSLLVKEV